MPRAPTSRAPAPTATTPTTPTPLISDDEDGVVFTSLLVGDSRLPRRHRLQGRRAQRLGRLQRRRQLRTTPASTIFSDQTRCRGRTKPDLHVPAGAAPTQRRQHLPALPLHRDHGAGRRQPERRGRNGEVEDYVRRSSHRHHLRLRRPARRRHRAPPDYPTACRRRRLPPHHQRRQPGRGRCRLRRRRPARASRASAPTATTSTAGPDDEDGIVFTSPLVAGATTTLTVNSSGDGQGGFGYLSGWVDFNDTARWSRRAHLRRRPS
jgi:hypothetical protein